MKWPIFSPLSAVFWGGLVAGTLDLAAVLSYWFAQGVMPVGIFQAIASSLMGAAAYQSAVLAPLLGFFLHWFVSFTFAGAYVLVALRIPLPIMLNRPLIFGLLYGAVAYIIMTYVVVPLSLAEFGPPGTLTQRLISISIHLFLFGLPIALAASRVKRA